MSVVMPLMGLRSLTLDRHLLNSMFFFPSIVKVASLCLHHKTKLEVWMEEVLI